MEAEHLLGRGTFTVLSLDVFDTLVWRTVPEPVDAFVLLGENLRTQGVLRDGVPPELFARLRERAELRARARVGAAGKVPEVRLDAIHREMPGHLYSVPPAEVADLEVDFEKTITFPDLEIVHLAEVAQAEHGVRLVLVSDTYYSDTELRRILDREPFDALKIDDVFTSSQYGVGKGFGLYRTVLEALGVPAREVLHIGDNADADEERARAEGIRTVLFDRYPGSLPTVLAREGLLRPDHRQREKPTLDPVRGDFGFSALRAKAVSQLEGAGLPAVTNPYWRFGATVLGPVFTGLAEWLHERAQEEGVDTLYCLMREGEFLSRLVNGARGYLRSPVRAETLWLSRQVCSRAAIFDADLGELQTFLDRRVRPTVAELCETLGLALAQLPELGGDADTRLDDREVATAFLRRITEEPHLRATIVSEAAALRGRLVDYVTRTVRPVDGRIVVADLGWGGTIQAKLDAALVRAGADLRTVGLYLLTNEGALDRTLDGLEAYGFLASGGIPDHTFWITRSPEILEQVCMHDEGTLVDFTEDGEPLLRPTPQGGAQALQRAAVQRGILAFQEHWARYREHQPADARRLGPGARAQLTRTVTRFVVSPTTEEVALFADWLHDQNYGSEAIDPVVRDTFVPMLQYLTPRQLLELPMAKVYWPFGMAAMHNPQLALGTGAVLSGTLPAEAFEAGQPCTVRVFVDSGGGFGEAVRKPAGPNVNGLCHVLAEVATRPVRGVMLRCSDAPGLLRLDSLTLSFDVAGEASPYLVHIESAGDFSRLQFRNGVLLADNVLLASRAAPEIVFRTPPEVAAAAYRVEVEAAFAWMATPRLRGRRSSKAEVAVQLGRKVYGKARNVWLSSEQEANERFRPED
ncbi:MAG TPA: HAD hydrolase-like protein [Acidimicrobiales bacterium]|nr:HAD hydrolase-like protein [Acidimicrobiales bacterium]